MNKNKEEINHKCYLKGHEDIISNIFCEECKIYMCNKCLILHNQFFINHRINKNENSIDIFAGICQEKNHNMKLEYFCKTHNELCCSSCLCKIKTNGNGKNKNCDVCSLKKIKNSKKNKLFDYF